MRWLTSMGMAFLAPAIVAAQPMPLLDDLVKASRETRYSPPTLEEFRTAQETFYRLFVEAKPPCEALRRLGFKLSRHEVRGDEWWVIKDVRHRGAGFYVLRKSSGRKVCPLLIQAPHSFYDSYTRRLGMHWMYEQRVTAAAWNTAHRYQLQGGASDVAHHGMSFFQAFTLAFARAHPEGGVVQLHGYSKMKRKDASAASGDVILSNGTFDPGLRITRIDQCIDRHFGEVSRVFPIEVSELGATTNVNAQSLQRLGFNGFVHIEMSKSMREKLLDVWYLRSRFFKCVMEGWECK